jgi:class 3 adenylate cyclase
MEQVSRIEIVCFTDLKGSTETTERLGNRATWALIEDHHRVTRSLAFHVGGEYTKSTGDGHVVVFSAIEHVLSFAVALQQYYDDVPGLARDAMEFRVGFALGADLRAFGELFGSAVNRAARIEGQASPREVTIDQPLYHQMRSVLGAAALERYFVALGERDLKGIDEAYNRHVYRFEWRRFGIDNPALGLVRVANDCLSSANIELSNISETDLSQPGIVIWPVVPRDIVNAIHRGQAEIIRILCFLGWQLQILIADCGARVEYEPASSASFLRRVTRYLEHRGVRHQEAFFMSKLFDPSSPGYEDIQTKFRLIASKITLAELLAINNKDYDLDVQNQIQRYPALDFLRPALTSAAVLFLAEKTGGKCIVVSGADERRQWQTMYSIGARDRVGVLMNPILKIDAVYQWRQKRDWPIWNSHQELIAGMEGTNLAWWVFRLHGVVPNFPSKTVECNGRSIDPRSWPENVELHADLTRDALTRLVWPFLDPNVPHAS